MNSKIISRDNNIKFNVLLFLFYILIIGAFFNFSKDSLLNNKINYDKFIKYTFSIFNDKGSIFSDFFKNNNLFQVSIDGIINKELNYFKTVDNLSAHKTEIKNTNMSFNINPFNIDNSQISKKVENVPPQNTEIYNPALKKNLDATKPEILIYHTHTTECYKPSGAEDDGTVYPKDSQDENLNVCSPGSMLKSQLENNYGIAAIQDKTMHNIEYYNGAYKRSSETLDNYLVTFGDFKLIIDMHRDASNTKEGLVYTFNGINAARIMFVVDESIPNYEENIKVVNKLIEISDRLFPGFCRGIYPYESGSNHFNQDKSNNSVLIEVGSNANTIDEANNTSEFLGRIIAEYLNETE